MMLIAYSMNMTNGDYAFIYTELIEKEAIGNTSWAGGNGKYEPSEFFFPLNLTTIFYQNPKKSKKNLNLHINHC